MLQWMPGLRFSWQSDASDPAPLITGVRAERQLRMDYRKIITVDPKRNGQPCIRGMPITVREIIEALAFRQDDG